ncbi:MAG: hypothetical protein MJZ74_01045 [Muribaculaceae bacterium]|nr:hypothetical protein [Muribaculaceae bacterium]
MKKIALLLIMVLAGATALQAKDKQEVVQLKNGHKVRGKIVQYAPLDSLVIQEEDGNQQTIRWEQIYKITKEKWQPQQSIGKSFTNGMGVQKGYRGFVDAEYYLALDARSKSRMGFSTSHGYQVLPYLYVGAGAGMQFITNMRTMADGGTGRKTFIPIPVFADVRLDLYKNKISPFVDMRVGKVFGDKAFDIMLNPSVGCRYELKNNLALNLSVGYSMQSTDLAPIWNEMTIHHYDKSDTDHIKLSWQNNPYRSLSFKLGIEF